MLPSSRATTVALLALAWLSSGTQLARLDRAALEQPWASAQGGWGVTNAKPHEVSRIYWELLPATEVLVPLRPVQPAGTPVRFHLVFHAFYPGRAARDWQTGLPAWPKGEPARLAVTAQAHPLTFAIPELSLRFLVDGTLYDLTGPGSRYRNVPCLMASDDCTPTGVEADISADYLRAIVAARRVEGWALGTRFVFMAQDREALTAFARRIGILS